MKSSGAMRRLPRDFIADDILDVTNIMSWHLPCPGQETYLFVCFTWERKPLKIVLFWLSVAVTSGGNPQFERTKRTNCMSPMFQCNIWACVATCKSWTHVFFLSNRSVKQREDILTNKLAANTHVITRKTQIAQCAAVNNWGDTWNIIRWCSSAD